jgi:hypothetical protein
MNTDCQYLFGFDNDFQNQCSGYRRKFLAQQLVSGAYHLYFQTPIVLFGGEELDSLIESCILRENGLNGANLLQAKARDRPLAYWQQST